MNYREVRKSFIDFFQKKDHRFVPSSSLVPYDDPTLLFTNAGMNQFKDVFLGTGKRDYTRAVNSQKCIRVSGKHNDLEEVGRDTYHHTFFEMLGNWSFGDYYKKEAIEWAWELLTKVWCLPKERLWATVYKSDDEAYNLWTQVTDIKKDHILRFGEKDNFWEMGEVGPCGPCSEIHFDLTDNGCKPEDINAGNPLVIEIWNLVFIQNNRLPDGSLERLPATHVDTGMGFERICAVLQGKKSNYDTDIFTPIITKISEITKQKYEGENNQVAMRVIADHIRSLTFAITDGAVPSNEGRGYVMRRILRRALRFARNLKMKDPILHKLVPTVVDAFGDFFPEIKEKQNLVQKIILSEEESFNSTLDRGLEIFEDIVKKNVKKDIKVISGEDVFKLYDTYGFPVDLTNLLALEKGFSIDMEGFNKLMNEQIERSRTSGKSFSLVLDDIHEVIKQLDFDSIPETKFIGYEETESKSNILAKVVKNNRTYIVFDKTPFYAESGGQVSDTGEILINGKAYSVIGMNKAGSHFIHVIDGILEDSCTDALLKIDVLRRRRIMQNHSATHLLHAALRKVLGSHVQQAGSLVDEEHLRFDFTHYQKMKQEEIKEVEKIVNQKILEALPRIRYADIEQEKAKEMGALAFFGDKYGDKVNVIKFGDFSMEFCGGTHVENTSDIGFFKILNESSISSGVRRIEAVTSVGIQKYLEELDKKLLEKQQENEILTEKLKQFEKEIKKFKALNLKDTIEHIINNSPKVEDIKVVSYKTDVESIDELKSIADMVRDKLKSGVAVLGAIVNDKAQIVAIVTDDLVKTKKLMAGSIVNEVAKIINGGGGGKPNFATAGGKDVSKLDEALKTTKSIVEKLYKK
ncbi:MAG TPA: alanine--tRNA ligase [Bacteroidota bacterium]|jgi:alanyl-tRNA synthetase|nr:alanine--tRNA ligase [Bacteroidota bacterium]